MINKFKFVKNPDGEDWNICFTGQDGNGDECAVTTNKVRATELSCFTLGADGDAKLIAELLNWYYTDIAAAENSITNVKEGV